MTAQKKADELEREYRSLAKNDPRRNEVWGRLSAARLSALRVSNRTKRRDRKAQIEALKGRAA